MYIAGGSALHLYTGSRVTRDVDAAFSHRIALPDDLEVSYPAEDGNAALLYFDRNYNDTLGLLHEDAYDNAIPIALHGVDRAVLDVRLLSPLDLAVSKLGRFSSQDREDIRTLARAGLINADALRQRAEEALGAYIGNLDRLRGSIDIVQGHRGALKHNCMKGRRSDLSLALTETGRSDASRRARNTAAAPNTYDT